MPKVQGIYEIRNVVSGRVYVGSSHDIIYRFRKHRERLIGGYHSSLRFQASWDKHGQDAFTFTILEVVAQRSDLHVREQHWIDTLDATNQDRGFNVRGTVEGTLGFQHTPEAVALIRAAGTGRKHTPEAKAKMSAARKSGPKRTLSEAHKAAIRASSKVWAGTPENRTKVSQQKAGRVVSEETKKRQSIALTGTTKGHKPDAKGRAKPGQFWTGRKHSDEAKARMSASAKARKKSNQPGYWAGKTRPTETRAKMTASHTARWAARRQAEVVETRQMALPLHSHS